MASAEKEDGLAGKQPERLPPRRRPFQSSEGALY
jgi:hypothetical protein